MGSVLYVRTPGLISGALPGSANPRECVPADLAAESGSVAVTAETPVALREKGPFKALAAAVAENGALRDELARGIAIPSLRDHSRIRFGILAAAALPMAMLIELDRELVTAHHAGPSRVVVDIILVAFIVFELTRRTPRMPGIAAVSLVAIALRWCLVTARLCGGHVHPLVYLAAALPAAAALVMLVRVPSRGRVALELLGKLGITRSALFAATQKEEPSGALIAAAVACAAGLPAVLHLTRLAGAGLVTQALVFVAFAAVTPELARRFTELSATRSATRRASVPPPQVLMGIVTGLAITAAAVTSARLFLDTGVELARCFARLDTEARLAHAAESAELARAVAQVRASAPLVIMTAVIFPFAEERVYRGLLQEVLVRKYGAGYGVFAASIAFGLAHVGIYQLALYQTVLLGIGFGIAYAEGGLLAAFVVHATWNLLQLA